MERSENSWILGGGERWAALTVSHLLNHWLPTHVLGDSQSGPRDVIVRGRPWGPAFTGLSRLRVGTRGMSAASEWWWWFRKSWVRSRQLRFYAVVGSPNVSQWVFLFCFCVADASSRWDFRR